MNVTKNRTGLGCFP